MYKIAIYGKGGIGKSTVCCNLSAALAKAGKTVMQIGCDPKADSTSLLQGGRRLPTVLQCTREKGAAMTLSDVVYPGEGGVLCVEAGGPMPGIGCAGRGIINALESLERLGAYKEYQPDIVIYDVLGDVVCGGFSMPMRGGYADKVYVVSSGEKMAVYAAANICMAVEHYRSRGYAQLGGIILNRRGVTDETETVAGLAADFHTAVFGDIERNAEIALAEKANQPVVTAFPDSPAAQQITAIAAKLLAEADA
ncbi:MAG: AAA family ATPase [Oscillospiraceae bacterium]|nr:AAA family ATPase [Oscillospiraceae bacterium]